MPLKSTRSRDARNRLRAVTPDRYPVALGARGLNRATPEQDITMDDILAPPPDGLGLSTPTNAPTNHVVSDRVVPRVTAGPVELRPLMTDPFLAYLLSRIDGVRTFGEMVALGSLSRPEWEAGLLTLLALDAVDLTFGDLE